jgi:N,N'-diacetyllegionaminate synthase
MVSARKANFIIEGREIGPNFQPYVIAEIAQTHEGSLGSAMAFVELAKDCGADAIKFQTHIAAEESTKHEPWRKKFSNQDATRYDYWKRMEFSFEQWKLLKNHADNVGITFLSSPFSILACQWLRELGMQTWKIASGEINNLELTSWIANTREPVILSSGMSTLAETESLLGFLRDQGSPVSLLHCTTQYPTPASQVGLNVFELYKQKWPEHPIGLSDHSGEIFPSIVASYLGAEIIEVHLTMHPKMFGPDVSSSLTPNQFRELISGVKYAWEMRKSIIEKDNQVSNLEQIKRIFSRSLVAKTKIEEGSQISENMIAYKKPGGGLPYEKIDSVIGKTAKRTILKDEVLRIDDVK